MSRSNNGVRTPLNLNRLEDRCTPAATATAPYAVGVPAGETGDVVVYNPDGTEQYTVAAPYGADFTGGVRVALADVTGDGTADLITAPGAGTAAVVKVFDGTTQAEVASFAAFESTFTGGFNVAAADITGDGRAEIVVGADQGGGPRVVVFDGATVSGTDTPTALADFLAIDDTNFRGGVRLALGDISGDGVADLLVGAGFRGGPRVAAFDGASLAQGQQVKLFPDFFAFEQSLRNGVFLSVGDLNGDGCGDMVFGGGPGGGPRIRALDGRAAMTGTETELANFFAGDSSGRQGVEPGVVTAADGTTSIVGTDVATGTANVFGTDGRGRGPLGGRGGRRGGFGGPAFESSGVTVGDADTVIAATVGTYAGTGTGVLSTLTTDGSAPTSTTEDVTVSVEITSAESVPTATADNADTRLRGLALTGTLTVTIGDAAPVTLSFTGTLALRGGSADDVSGRIYLTADATATASGFTLSGSLKGGEISVNWLVVSDHSTGSGGYVFQSPESRTADRLTLALA